ncbi:MAG: hypothetical protein JWN86_4561 [Planctomycetota bacterium]|nr:hypothetical protein [Planctomycetota bacterium]
MRNRFLAGLLGILAVGGMAVAFADDERDAPPPAYAPFEHLIGGWKGQGIPAKNRLKGWPEQHMWAWKFVKGKPVGLSVEIKGGKFLAKGQLKHDDKGGLYTLEGTDTDGKPVVFSGKLDEDTQILSIERQDAPAELGKERVDIALNQNKIRYTMRLFRQEPDAPQFALVYDANLGKDGESFAAGGAAADLPKCIVTGGAGGMTVAFEGKSYPICCTGCRDEFNDNPAKYVKKYLLRLEKGEAAPLKTTAAGPVEAKANVETPSVKAMPKATIPKTKSGTVTTKPDTKPAAQKGELATKAASILSQGQALEKSGKTQAALTYYKRVAKEFPDTPAARTALAKIKALGGK